VAYRDCKWTCPNINILGSSVAIPRCYGRSKLAAISILAIRDSMNAKSVADGREKDTEIADSQPQPALELPVKGLHIANTRLGVAQNSVKH